MAEDEASSKRVVLQIFGEELGEKLALAAGYGRRKDYRGVLEPTDAVTQCEKAGHPFIPNVTTCYICGFVIPDKALLSGVEDELYVECEHIFPVTEARWYLDLYMSTRKPIDEWTKQAVNLEYAQAHRVCNQAKSNDSFIKDEGGRPVFSDVGTRKILLKIQTRARKHVNDYPKNKELGDIMKGIANTILARKDDIKAIIEPLIEHVDKTPPESINLLTLARTSLIEDVNALPRSLQEIYYEWKAGEPEMQQRLEDMFIAFLDQTYTLYPNLRPENIDALIFGTLPNGEPYQQYVTPELVKSVLREFFLAFKGNPDPSGKTLLSTVYYAIYGILFNKIIESGIQDDVKPLFCRLLTALETIEINEPSVIQTVGKIDITERHQDICKIYYKNAERAARAARKDEDEDEDLEEEPPTASEDAVYFLSGLGDGMYNTLRKNEKFSDEKTRTIVEEVGIAMTMAFIHSYEQGIDEAKRAAAEIATYLLTLGGISEESVKKISELIIANRADETQTYGGLRGRRPLYTNAQTVDLPRSNTQHNPRLRKRARTRRATRIRQSTRKSKTR